MKKKKNIVLGNKNAFVYTSGEIFPEYIEESPGDNDIVICADGGYNNAKMLGVKKIDVLIGDFDSLDGELPNDIPEILQVPEKKDLTDTQLAVEKAIIMGASHITIVASTSGRLDHTLSTLAILENLHERGARGTIVSGQNRITYIKNSGHIVARGGYDYFSLLALDKARGVSVDGGEYPLKNAELDRKLQYAVSNKITHNCALINVRKGGLFIIESKDI